MMEPQEGPIFSADENERIFLGDQHHAEAIDALRQARKQPWVLMVEQEIGSVTMFSAMPESQDGLVLHRMANYLARASAHLAQLAVQVLYSDMANRIFQRHEEDDDA